MDTPYKRYSIVIGIIVAVALLGGLISYLSVQTYDGNDYSFQSFPIQRKSWIADRLPYLPYDPAYNNYTVVLDGHSHTIYSDGKLTPRENIMWHLAHGYNAMVLTDHHNITGALFTQQLARAEFNDLIKVIVGMEWTTIRIHMNLIGVNESLPKIYNPTDDQIKQVINRTHEIGGIVVVNHIPLSNQICKNQPNISTLYDWGVDYVEVVNQKTFDSNSYDFSKETGMGLITGTDMHRPNITVYSWTVLNIQDYTEESIFNALKNRKTSFLYSLNPDPNGDPSMKWMIFIPIAIAAITLGIIIILLIKSILNRNKYTEVSQESNIELK